MKKRIDSLVSLYEETTEVNDLIRSLNPKLLSLRKKMEMITKRYWITKENVLKRKKVSLKSRFVIFLPEKRSDRNFPISSLNISYVAESNLNKNSPGLNTGLSGIYLGLRLKTKCDSFVDIGIAANDGCAPLPMIYFDKLHNHLSWETYSIEFEKLEELETVIDFCESALNEVNEKLASANLKAMKKMFHIH
jgi:hypothetical protein